MKFSETLSNNVYFPGWRSTRRGQWKQCLSFKKHTSVVLFEKSGYYEELWFYLSNLCQNIWMSINLFAKLSPDLLIFSTKCCNVVTDTAKWFSFSPFVTLHYFLWQAFASRIDFSKYRSYSAFKVQAEYVIHAAIAILYFDEIFNSKQQSCT